MVHVRAPSPRAMVARDALENFERRGRSSGVVLAVLVALMSRPPSMESGLVLKLVRAVETEFERSRSGDRWPQSTGWKKPCGIWGLPAGDEVTEPCVGRIVVVESLMEGTVKLEKSVSNV